MNKRAERFRGRKTVQEALQKEADSKSTLQQGFIGLAQEVFSQKTQINRLLSEMRNLRSKADAAHYLSRALNNLMPSKIPQDQVLGEIERLQVEDFNEASKEDDTARNLVDASDETAQNGLHAIIQMNTFKDGKEIVDERMVRSKIEIGKVELLQEIDELLVGMKVGERKRFPLNIQGKTDEAEVVLIGLRKKQEVAQEAQATGEQSS
ncbi:MAG: hypothetical protein EBU90_23340 [Proteobacteria bacterium]|nr:hypothetical protein [Pseudomonadota bacterium]